MGASNIILFGFMGTGKTSVGRLLAERLGLRFADMDDVIVAREGRSIPEIFSADGQAAFRASEHAVACALGAERGLVVATGGGVVLMPENVAALGADGLLVCLRATRETILDRVGGDPNRPLLQGGADGLEALLAAREPFYADLPNQIWTDERSLEDVAAEIQRLYEIDSEPSA